MTLTGKITDQSLSTARLRRVLDTAPVLASARFEQLCCLTANHTPQLATDSGNLSLLINPHRTTAWCRTNRFKFNDTTPRYHEMAFIWQTVHTPGGISLTQDDVSHVFPFGNVCRICTFIFTNQLMTGPSNGCTCSRLKLTKGTFELAPNHLLTFLNVVS